ncbi:death-associated protein 1 isoform X1 [Heterocephalus glaber]|uniref:Death-associated protein 1 isoform X1 n=1 Tax=Heterocephalus glaber TaxID=10181 RepID=A0AAX6P746_HETGA|nr:death-associated protein 1 isoform X1 [Heterocephalus glaber]
MSSPPEGKVETKAGHLPAVKAGGMRIVQKHPHTGDGKEERDKDDQEWESARSHRRCRKPRLRLLLHPACCLLSISGARRGLEPGSPPKPTVFISGVIARGDRDFPPAAAQVAHQKPHASIDKHPSPRTQHIQQPRK